MNSPLFYLFLIGVTVLTKIGVEYYAKWAQKHGIVDKADGLRKLQKAPTPVSGGVVIYAVSTLAIIAGVVCYNITHPHGSAVSPVKVAVILGSAFILVAIGFSDDRGGLKGKRKLLLQLLASSLIVSYAQNYSSVELFGRTFNLGHLFFPLALFWLAGFINAINLIDGADGVAATVGMMIFITVGLIGFLHGAAYSLIAFLAFVMAAALFGFFLCNRPPAKIYLGDSGSMLIGFMAAILLINVCSVGKGTVRFFPAFSIAFLPILDSFSAIVRRTLAGRSIYFADRSHLHHRIQTHFGRDWKLLGMLVFLQIPLSAGGIIGTLLNSRKYAWSDLVPLGAAFLVLVFLITTNIFGRNELKLMILAVKKVLTRILIRRKKKPNQPNTFINLQEDDWKLLWKSILRQTAGSPCFYVQLDINIPPLEVDFFASKGEQAVEKGINADPRSIMTLRIPLLIEEKDYSGNLLLQYDMVEPDSLKMVELAEKLKDESVTAIKAFLKAHRDQDERFCNTELNGKASG